MDEEEQRQRFRRGYVRMAALFLAMLAVPLAAYSLWDKYYNSSAQGAAEQYQAVTKAYEDAMRADTYGGKTPEETLQMLISALKAGDIDTAAKYFLLEQNPNDPNYLTRKKWEDALAAAKSNKTLTAIASKLSRVKKSSESNEDAAFESLNNAGIVDVLVEMRLDKLSGVWKIESL